MFITRGPRHRPNRAFSVVATIAMVFVFLLVAFNVYLGYKGGVAGRDIERLVRRVLTHRYEEHYALITDDALHQLQKLEKKGVLLGSYKSSFSDFFVTSTFGVVQASYRKAPAEVIFTGYEGMIVSVRLDPPLDQ